MQVLVPHPSGLFLAVKVLHSHLAENEDFISRFEREPAVIARLRHPNIVQVFDFDVEGDLYYMVMELIAGPTLHTELKERGRSAPTNRIPIGVENIPQQ